MKLKKNRHYFYLNFDQLDTAFWEITKLSKKEDLTVSISVYDSTYNIGEIVEPYGVLDGCYYCPCLEYLAKKYIRMS